MRRRAVLLKIVIDYHSDCFEKAGTFFGFVNTENANSLIGDGTELDLIFQFDLMDMDGDGSKWNPLPFSITDFKAIVDKWQQAIDWNTLFWGNHDQPRIVSRFGCTDGEEMRVRSAKCLATAMYLLRGTPFIYQGEEIGMTNYPFACEEELRDVESINLLHEAKKENRTAWAWNGILKKGRDNARTPMQWDASDNAGFSAGTPWIGVYPNYPQINVERAMAGEGSILHFYKQLIALRNGSETLKYGDFTMLLPEHPQLFAYSRALGDEKITVCCNFGDSEVEIPQICCGKVLLSIGADGQSLPPYGAVVMEV